MVTNQSDEPSKQANSTKYEPVLDMLLNRESAWESLQYRLILILILIELLFNLNHRLLQNIQYELGMEM